MARARGSRRRNVRRFGGEKKVVSPTREIVCRTRRRETPRDSKLFPETVSYIFFRRFFRSPQKHSVHDDHGG